MKPFVLFLTLCLTVGAAQARDAQRAAECAVHALAEADYGRDFSKLSSAEIDTWEARSAALRQVALQKGMAADKLDRIFKQERRRTGDTVRTGKNSWGLGVARPYSRLLTRCNLFVKRTPELAQFH